jgi:hypothetical protein
VRVRAGACAVSDAPQTPQNSVLPSAGAPQRAHVGPDAGAERRRPQWGQNGSRPGVQRLQYGHVPPSAGPASPASIERVAPTFAAALTAGATTRLPQSSAKPGARVVAAAAVRAHRHGGRLHRGRIVICQSWASWRVRKAQLAARLCACVEAVVLVRVPRARHQRAGTGGSVRRGGARCTTHFRIHFRAETRAVALQAAR